MASDLQEGKAMVERKFQEMLDIGTVAIKDINREFHLQALPAIKRLAKEVGTMVVGREFDPGDYEPSFRRGCNRKVALETIRTLDCRVPPDTESVLPSLEQPPLFLREINSEAKRGLSGEHKPLKAACRILLLVRCMSQWHKLNDTEGGRVKFYPEEVALQIALMSGHVEDFVVSSRSLVSELKDRAQKKLQCDPNIVLVKDWIKLAWTWMERFTKHSCRTEMFCKLLFSMFRAVQSTTTKSQRLRQGSKRWLCQRSP
ncbi:unnamed protein product [Durusdinium trenchii]|uniref:Uncharacterized protein n=1 Tax=Durusdinium trenchii TaxID=1381693 RepID=A0ABP0RBQ3_9DINO